MNTSTDTTKLSANAAAESFLQWVKMFFNIALVTQFGDPPFKWSLSFACDEVRIKNGQLQFCVVCNVEFIDHPLRDCERIRSYESQSIRASDGAHLTQMKNVVETVQTIMQSIRFLTDCGTMLAYTPDELRKVIKYVDKDPVDEDRLKTVLDVSPKLRMGDAVIIYLSGGQDLSALDFEKFLKRVDMKKFGNIFDALGLLRRLTA